LGLIDIGDGGQFRVIIGVKRLGSGSGSTAAATYQPYLDRIRYALGRNDRGKASDQSGPSSSLNEITPV